MRRAMVLLATPASVVTSRWRMTRSDDRTLRPSATAVSRVLTVLRPRAVHGQACTFQHCAFCVVLSNFCRSGPGWDSPVARHITGRTGHEPLSCEHHHWAGEAPAAAFDSNLRTAHRWHSLSGARDDPAAGPAGGSSRAPDNECQRW